MNERIVEIHSAEEIAGRVSALAGEISEAHGRRELTMLSSLEESFVFFADLLRAMRVPVRTAFLRYDHRATGSFQNLSFTAQTDITGRDIVLVEGVLDTGVTQEYLIKQLESQGAASVRLCVLLDKTRGRRTPVEPQWRAFQANEDYVFGYGLGVQERWRELPFLATFARE